MKFSVEDTEDEGGGLDLKPGIYEFKVDECVERTHANGNPYSTGSEGVSVRLMAAALPDRDVAVFFNLVDTPKARWKAREFARSLDINSKELDSDKIYGLRGWAKFKIGARGYLEPEEFLDPVTAKKRVAASDDVPW